MDSRTPKFRAEVARLDGSVLRVKEFPGLQGHYASKTLAVKVPKKSTPSAARIVKYDPSSLSYELYAIGATR